MRNEEARPATKTAGSSRASEQNRSDELAVKLGIQKSAVEVTEEEGG